MSDENNNNSRDRCRLTVMVESLPVIEILIAWVIPQSRKIRQLVSIISSQRSRPTWLFLRLLMGMLRVGIVHKYGPPAR